MPKSVDPHTMEVEGNCFTGDATKCFKGQLSKTENLRLAELYWENSSDGDGNTAICEMLVDGKITVIEIVKEINANMQIND